MDWTAHLQPIIDRVNALETTRHREYYDYLVERGQTRDSLQQHLATFASLASCKGPATAQEIADLARMSGPPLPAALQEFYRTTGGFHGGKSLNNLEFPSPAELVSFARPGVEKWQALATIGIVDVMRHAWGNDRFELEPESGEGLTSDEVQALNAKFSAIGWHDMESGEAFNFLYFDASGRFGILFYHQDAFDELDADLARMMEGGAANKSFAEALDEFIAAAERG